MNNIWNPEQQEFVTLNTKQGIKTLRNYLKHYVAYGGSEKTVSDNFKKLVTQATDDPENTEYLHVKRALQNTTNKKEVFF